MKDTPLYTLTPSEKTLLSLLFRSLKPKLLSVARIVDVTDFNPYYEHYEVLRLTTAGGSYYLPTQLPGRMFVGLPPNVECTPENFGWYYCERSFDESK